MPPTTMTAIRIHAFGEPEVLVPERVPVPEPGPGDVLIRVHAAGLNPPDWYARRAFDNIPKELRPVLPLPYLPGSDASGVVVAAGADVTEWRPGDEVFGLIRFPTSLGTGGKTYAEYATAPAGELARKPASIDHVSAAAVPMAGLTAYQWLFDHIRLQKGRTVLVNGAAGGVGHFAVQLAKTHDATVIGVASGRHRAFLAGLGVNRFVDYTTESVSELVRDVDHVVDTVGGPTGFQFLSVVKPGGTISPVFWGEYHRDEAAGRGITFPSGQVHSDGAQMAELAALLDSGQVRAGIDSVFPLTEAAAAHRRAEQGHLQGKLVLRVVS